MGTFKTAFLVFSILLLSAFSTEKTAVKLASFQSQILEEVNDLRAKGCKCGRKFMPPVPPLKWNTLLEQSAKVHARDMRRGNFFSHTGSDGSTITQRIKRQGFITPETNTYYVAENIAYGYPSIKRVIYEWKISEGHCVNMMNAKITEMGVVELDKFWVQDLGFRR